MVKHNAENELHNGRPSRRHATLTNLVIAVALLFSCTVNAELILNGSTIYTDLGRDQFVAGLYMETAQNNPDIIQDMDSEKRMEVRILNNYSKRRWVNLWMQSISINNSRENFLGSAEELIALMQAPKSAPKEGDVLEYLFSPESGTSMRFNGTALISGLSGEVFGLLLRTWIGAIPPSTSFKEELLGNQRNSAARDLLQSITPDKRRIALAASWILPEPVKTVPKKAKTKKSVPPQQELQLASSESVELKEQREEDPGSDTESTKVEQSSANQSTESDHVDANEIALADQISPETSDPGAEEIEEEIEEEMDDEVDLNVVMALATRDYTPQVLQKIYQNIVYPSRAVSKNQEGTVRVAMVIGRSGELKNVLATQESKHRILNRAALRAVKKAAPFPVLPEEIKADVFELSVPITFQLK